MGGDNREKPGNEVAHVNEFAERCFTSLKTAAGAHNPEQYGPVYFKTIFRAFQVFSAKVESPPLHHVYERIRSIR